MLFCEYKYNKLNMSINIKHVPPLDVLIMELRAYPEHLKYYQNADALIGPPDSVDYLQSLTEDEIDDI